MRLRTVIQCSAATVGAHSWVQVMQPPGFTWAENATQVQRRNMMFGGEQSADSCFMGLLATVRGANTPRAGRATTHTEHKHRYKRHFVTP